MRLLYIEDQVDAADIVLDELNECGFAVDHAATIEDARYVQELATYDAMILDRKLPDGDGLSWLRSIRKSGTNTPAIILSGYYNDQHEVISALRNGADDFLAKPFHIDELIARLRAILRRGKVHVSNVLSFGDIRLDPVHRKAQVRDLPVLLSRRELTLLECLIERPGRVVSKEFLLQSLYSFNEEPSDNAIEVSVHRLRRILDAAESDCRVITHRGLGYELVWVFEAASEKG